MVIKNRKNAEQIHGKDITIPSASDDKKVMVFNAETDSYHLSNRFKDFHSLDQSLSYTQDEERRFFKDDFTSDTSDNYTGDVDDFTWDTANNRVKTVGTAKVLQKKSLNFYGYREFTHWSSTQSEKTYGYLLLEPTNGLSSSIITIYPFPGGGTGYPYIQCSIIKNGIGIYGQAISSSGMLKTDPHRFGVEVLNNAVKFYVDGVLKLTYTGSEHLSIFNQGVIYNSIILSNNSTTKTAELYATDLVDAPSISYSDDFATDTTERYQAVTGTVAYDDANKRMNVTTATGANEKASGRLKSYKFCEGSQIYDVLLPTGADGDFICLATHSANGLMTDGIGVGLQSDGAGNWNLATLSNTTVTEGASSGLVDGKTARIEIEKDLSGAYWYYIYDAAGAKPTDATGKLFTTLTEGYTGWYANGNSKTYAIDNISIRAESIVGRTNVQVTEDVFNSVTGEIESRTYFKPIHRGAMLETYHDGTQEVVGTTFIDDCQWDRSAEYTSLRGTWTHDTTNGYIQVTTPVSYGLGYSLKSLQFDEGVIEFDVCRYVAEQGDPAYYGIILNSDGELNSSNYQFPKNGILVATHSLAGEYVNGTLVGSPYTNVPLSPSLVWQKWRIELKKSQGQILLYLNGALAYTYTIAQNHVNRGITFFAYNSSRGSNVRFKNIQIIAASPDATNGIAACIPPIGGGARYDTQESITQTIDMSGIVSSDLKAYSSAISTNAAETALLRITAKNDTDDTSVYSDGTTKYWDVVMDGTVINTRKALETNFNDKDDSIVLTHSTDSGVPDGCIYVRETIVKPITVVEEDDLT